MPPRLSVVIPAYNNADYIAATVGSVLDQSYRDFELIIADHSSTDGTLATLEPFRSDPRVRILSTPSGGGAPRNWNRVTEEAQGEFLKLVCGDDIVYPGCFEEQMAAIERNPKVTAVASARDIVNARGDVLIRNRGLGKLSGTVSGAEAVKATVRSGTNIFGEPACVLLRRSSLVQAGLWDARFPYLIDEASYANVMLQGDVVAIRKPLAAFRISNSQWSVRLARSQAEQAHQFHRAIHALRPDVVSASDVRVGNMRASVMAVLRRLAYVRFRKQMGTTA